MFAALVELLGVPVGVLTSEKIVGLEVVVVVVVTIEVAVDLIIVSLVIMDGEEVVVTTLVPTYTHT